MIIFRARIFQNLWQIKIQPRPGPWSGLDYNHQRDGTRSRIVKRMQVREAFNKNSSLNFVYSQSTFVGACISNTVQLTTEPTQLQLTVFFLEHHLFPLSHSKPIIFCNFSAAFLVKKK